MSKNCSLKGCNNTAKQLGLFKFPSTPEIAQKWMDLLKHGLPDTFRADQLQKYTVCGAHFPEGSIYQAGPSKRLFYNALPNHIEPPPPAPKVLKETPGKIILNLRGKVSRLEKKLAALKSDPSPKFILKHRSKLRQFMSRDAFVMFDNCCTNYLRKPASRRHTYEAKRFTDELLYQSKEAFKIMQPIFALPTTWTIERLREAGSTITEDPQSLLPSDLDSSSSDSNITNKACESIISSNCYDLNNV